MIPIRNIALVGQSGAGKTTLAEKLLERAGAIPKAGSIQERNTLCDHLPEEQQAGHSLDPALCHLTWEGVEINLLDTPGHPELMGRTFSVLPAVETVLVVLDATQGLELVAERAVRFAQQRGKDVILLINHIDAPEADLAGTLAELRQAFGRKCLPLNLPNADGKGVQDCFFHLDGEPTAFSSVEEAHTDIIEQVIDLDEALMEAYLEQGQSLKPEQLHEPFERALRENHLIPVCFASATTGAGIEELLEAMHRLFPDPSEGNPPQFLRGDQEPVELQPDPERHVVAHLFKITDDPYTGRQGLLRLFQGTLRRGAQLYLGDGRKPLKVTHLYRPQGAEMVEIEEAAPGQICALTRQPALHFDGVLHDSHEEDHHHLRTLELPAPMFGLALTAQDRNGAQKLPEALRRLIEEDPSARLENHEEVGEWVLYASGALHARVLLERMERRDKLTVDSKPPSIPYRETITRSAQGHARHKKQTGGAGQFGEVEIEIQPLPRGEGFVFESKVVGGAIPRELIPAVEKGVIDAMAQGPVAGYPMQDIKVSVLDGKTHAVDSKEIAFVIAGRKAMLDALEQAGAVILEPIVNCEVSVPADHMGDVTGDLATHRGRIQDSFSGARGNTRLQCQLPLVEAERYQARLSALTEGRGHFTMSMSHYDQLPHELMDTVPSARKD